MGELFATVINLILTPIQLVWTILNVFVSNVPLIITMFALFAFLSIVSRQPQEILAWFINQWNSGTGVTLNYLIVKPLELAQYFLMYVVPIYNATWYFVSQLLRMLFFDLVQVNLAVVAKFVENAMLFFGACGLSLTSWASNVAECFSVETLLTQGLHHNVSYIPWTAPNMDCIGNDNQFMLDLMTPGLYVRNLASNVNELLALSCSDILLPINGQ